MIVVVDWHENLVFYFQKYRLHTRKMPNATSSISQPVMVMRGLCVPDENYTTLPRSASHSGSPESPLQLANSNHAISANAGDSCEEVDEKSENYNLRWENFAIEHNLQDAFDIWEVQPEERILGALSRDWHNTLYVYRYRGLCWYNSGQDLVWLDYNFMFKWKMGDSFCRRGVLDLLTWDFWAVLHC